MVITLLRFLKVSHLLRACAPQSEMVKERDTVIAFFHLKVSREALPGGVAKRCKLGTLRPLVARPLWLFCGCIKQCQRRAAAAPPIELGHFCWLVRLMTYVPPTCPNRERSTSNVYTVRSAFPKLGSSLLPACLVWKKICRFYYHSFLYVILTSYFFPCCNFLFPFSFGAPAVDGERGACSDVPKAVAGFATRRDLEGFCGPRTYPSAAVGALPPPGVVVSPSSLMDNDPSEAESARALPSSSSLAASTLA